MIPKRIELENFLSFGKPAAEFSFLDDEPLWALCGRNGVGKSAVFDGITYALYGEHRGGGQKAERLIRHGANGFRVVFEFEFAGVDYRITRVRAGRTSQKVEHRVEKGWAAVPGVDSAADVKAWVEQTLGLGYKAFTTSVLLRQGEADKLFSATRDERIAVLKGIIGFDRFEEISGRVHAATVRRSNALEALRGHLDTLEPVAPEDLVAAEEAVTNAEGKREEAQAALAAAVQRVERAKQWEGLEKKRAGLEQQLTAAEQRAPAAATIRADKARLDDLTVAVPELKSLVGLRDKIAQSEPKLTEAESSRDATSAAVEATAKALGEARQKEEQHKRQAEGFSRLAQTLKEEIDRGAGVLQLAETLEKLKEQLAAYPADLADRVATAEAAEVATTKAKEQAGSDLAAALALLQQAQDRRDRFADVQAGVLCSRCGQRVDEAHAAKERNELAQAVKDQEFEVEQLRVKATAAQTAFSESRDRRLALQTDKRDFDSLATEFQATSTSLARLGVVSGAAELRDRLATQGREKTDAETHAVEETAKQTEASKEAKRLDGEREKLDAKLRTMVSTVHTLEIQLATDRSAHDSTFARLALKWQSSLPNLNSEGVGKLAADRDRLKASGVAAQFELLRQDDDKRAEWSKQLDEARSEISRIPEDGRISEQEARRHQDQTKVQEDLATGTRDTAVRTLDGLRNRAEEYDKVKAQLRTAERQHDLHKKLDSLLGPNGLQRELVRDAEQQIVELANDTLQNLSDGEMSLEPDDEAAGREDKAFALRVRRTGDPLPIGVLFLSGSQKFRVAVSVALAVGRFASGRARPLEAVIIDEGFGSLDKDGLRAMAEELKRLQRSQSLRRVILVSHQDEFTEQFPVGYRLSNTENGTVVAPFRR